MIGISSAVNPSDVQRWDAVGASSLWPTFSISAPNIYSSRRRCISIDFIPTGNADVPDKSALYSASSFAQPVGKVVFSCLSILYLVQGRMSIVLRLTQGDALTSFTHLLLA